MKTLTEPLRKDLYSTEKKLCTENPLFLIYGNFLSIKTKDGRLIKLKLNSTQEKLFKKIIELRKQRKPIRAWVLKYRQGGVSTFIEALIFALTSIQPNRNSLIMADMEDKSTHLFEMSKLYQEKIEKDYPHLSSALKKSNAKKLEFEDLHSQIIIETGKNVNATRAFTYQYVHLSEVAFFPDLSGVLAGLNQSVPDHWDTIILGETTANGMDNFYTEWIRAIERKTDWIPLFFPWFMMEEYRKPLKNGVLYPLEGLIFDAETTEQSFIDEENALQMEFDLDNEQINWRRFAIINKCQGDIIRFRTEYPATWQEAFSLSGTNFFDRKGLKKQKSEIPKLRGELFKEQMEYEFRSLKYGRIEVFERPSEGEQYFVVADASEAVGQDEASILVLNSRINSTAAVVAGQYTPEELAEMCISLGAWYNTAMIIPENKGYGYMVCQLVFNKYGNIYKRIKTTKGTKETTEELGFNTNSVTRPQMLAQMNEEIRQNTTQLKSAKLISQCQTFVTKYDKEGKAKKVEAQTGFQDGLVICRAIAGFVRHQYPYKVVSKSSIHAKQRRAVEEKLKKRNAGIGF